MIEFKTTNPKALVKQVERAEADLRKDQLNAIKTEGFSLRMTMMQAIRMGKPAPGQSLKELSMIARTINRKSGVRQHRPLQQLASAITYDVDPAGLEMRVGFTKRSAPWSIRAAEAQQRGFTRPVTPMMRLMMRRKGAQRLFSRSWRGRRTGNPLFLKLTTTRLTTPPRPIVAPFWASEKDKSAVRIRRNFRLISRGKVAPGGNIYTVQDMVRW